MKGLRIAKSTGVLMGVLVLAVLFWPLRNDINRQFDRQTSEDLNVISSAVDNYFSANSSLPENLDDLGLDDEVRNRAHARGYEFNRDSFDEYRLCADFRAASDGDGAGFDIVDSLAPSSGNDTSVHAKGRSCFDYEASPFDSFQQSQGAELDNLPFDLDDLEGQLEGIEGLEGLLVPETIESLDSLEL